MMTTHIANAFSSDIEAKVTVNKEYLLTKLTSKQEGETFGPFSLNFGKSFVVLVVLNIC